MKRAVKRNSCVLVIVFLLLCISATVSVAAPKTENQKTIRVGWYDYDGFYMQDEEGHRSGYGYDYFQEIARYSGWDYEYVNGTVTECFQMLEEGQIDLLGSVMYSPERANTLEFSALSSGKNYSVLTINKDDNRYQIGNTKALDGIHIGALYGDIRQNELMKYAAEQGFTYRLTYYDTPAMMEEALSTKEVDAILTTNMRVATGSEQIVAQFAPVEFYIVTAKGNFNLIKSVNTAMEQIEFTRKGFQAELSQKYFSVDMSGALSFTEEEKEFIRSTPVIRVILPAMRRPVAYKDGKEYKGVVVDIINELAECIDIKVEYLEADTQSAGIQNLIEKKGDVIANVYDDYGWAESNDLFLTRSYMDLNYAAITRVGNLPSDLDIRVAAVTGYHFSADYVERMYQPSQIEWYDNESEALEAVRADERDICFVSSLAANEFLTGYKYREFRSSAISYSHGLSIGVSKEDRLLLSILDKAIASMGSAKIRSIIDTNTMLLERPFNLAELIMCYPLQFISIFGFILVIIVSLLVGLIIGRSNRRKNEEIYRARLAAECDSLTGLYNRITFEVVVTQKLQEKGDKLSGVFVMLDIDLFKQINDQHGHSYGDKVLTLLAEKLRESFEHHSALLCRMGGDEFALFFPEWNKREDLIMLLQECQRELKEGGVEKISISCSFGVAFVSEQLCNFPALYKAADEALYSAKRADRGAVYIRET